MSPTTASSTKRSLGNPAVKEMLRLLNPHLRYPGDPWFRNRLNLITAGPLARATCSTNFRDKPRRSPRLSLRLAGQRRARSPQVQFRLAAVARSIDVHQPGVGEHRSVMINPKTSAWTATITSGTVDMPTTSTPIVETGIPPASQVRAVTARRRPLWAAKFLPASLPRRDQLGIVRGHHVGKSRSQAH